MYCRLSDLTFTKTDHGCYIATEADFVVLGPCFVRNGLPRQHVTLQSTELVESEPTFVTSAHSIDAVFDVSNSMKHHVVTRPAGHDKHGEYLSFESQGHTLSNRHENQAAGKRCPVRILTSPEDMDQIVPYQTEQRFQGLISDAHQCTRVRRDLRYTA